MHTWALQAPLLPGLERRVVLKVEHNACIAAMPLANMLCREALKTAVGAQA